MDNSDEFRRQVDFCRQMSAKCVSSHDKAEWLRLAQDWMNLVGMPKSDRERFDELESRRGTGQEPSTSDH